MPEELNEITGAQTALVIGGAENMLSNVVDVVKKLLADNDAGIYIAVNQPYKVLSNLLSEKGIDTSKLFFIDCITKSAVGEAEKSENCLYLSSPSDLTELSLGITQALEALKGEKKFVFIDSLGTFLIYNSTGTISKFSHFLITKVSVMGVHGIFMSIEKEMDEKLISELQSFCQKTIRLK